MTLYIVRAKPKSQLSELRKEMDSGKISNLKPFGKSLQRGLEMQGWIKRLAMQCGLKKDYCSPPLTMERESGLDRYFDDITVDRVKFEGE